jgi:5-methylcytosine-specific restriction endonuclease McrA
VAKGNKFNSPQLNFFATVDKKTCTKCKIEQGASCFGPRFQSPDGLRDWCNSCGAEHQRKYYQSDLEKNRKRKRESMARARQDPSKRQQMRDRQNAHYHANKTLISELGRAKYKRRFFWSRAMKLKGPNRACTADVSRLWKYQRGLCALTGRRLDRSAQLDHIVPKAKGGDDSQFNLQWVCNEVNYAKRDLSEGQFSLLCADVMTWLGERIRTVSQHQQNFESKEYPLNETA